MTRRLHPLHLVLGPIIWAGWFVAMYAGLSVTCNVAPPLPEDGAVTWLNGALLVMTLVVSGCLLFTGWRCWRKAAASNNTNGFIARVAAGTYLLSAMSTLMIGVPVSVLPPCV